MPSVGIEPGVDSREGLSGHSLNEVESTVVVDEGVTT